MLRAHDRLCASPQLFDEMLQQGLLPSPAKAAAAPPPPPVTAAEAEEPHGRSAGTAHDAAPEVQV